LIIKPLLRSFTSITQEIHTYNDSVLRIYSTDFIVVNLTAAKMINRLFAEPLESSSHLYF